MALPAITLPKVELPFDIPVLLHPAVDHFMIALPVVILVLELINLMMKKKALSGFSFFLIILTVVFAAGAYLTGLADGKEAFPALGEAAKSALAEHKLLGTYLMLASAVLLLFKLLSMLAGSFMKTLYLLVLIVFVVGIFKQGKEGGELVYRHGMNVEKVKVLDDEIFDLKDALEDAKDTTVKTEVPAETVKSETVEATPKVPAVPAVQELPVKSPVEAAPVKAVTESVKTQVEKEVVPAVEEKVETVRVEGMPEETVQPEIATH